VGDAISTISIVDDGIEIRDRFARNPRPKHLNLNFKAFSTPDARFPLRHSIREPEPCSLTTPSSISSTLTQ
jgi:hypothetical protein